MKKTFEWTIHRQQSGASLLHRASLPFPENNLKDSTNYSIAQLKRPFNSAHALSLRVDHFG
jgi:hypothetical protein